MNIIETDRKLINNSYFLETYFNGYMFNPSGLFIPRSIMSYESQHEGINQFVENTPKTMCCKNECEDDLTLSLYTLSNYFEYKRMLSKIREYVNETEFEYIEKFNNCILESKKSEILALTD